MCLAISVLFTWTICILIMFYVQDCIWFIYRILPEHQEE